MARIDESQRRVTFRIEGYLRKYAYAYVPFDIGLDHVRIERGERDVRLEIARIKGFAYRRFTVERKVVGDYRKAGDRFERERLFMQQRMRGRRDDCPIPLVTRQHHDIFDGRIILGDD